MRYQTISNPFQADGTPFEGPESGKRHDRVHLRRASRGVTSCAAGWLPIRDATAMRDVETTLACLIGMLRGGQIARSRGRTVAAVDDWWGVGWRARKGEGCRGMRNKKPLAPPGRRNESRNIISFGPKVVVSWAQHLLLLLQNFFAVSWLCSPFRDLPPLLKTSRCPLSISSPSPISSPQPPSPSLRRPRVFLHPAHYRAVLPVALARSFLIFTLIRRVRRRRHHVFARGEGSCLH
jgi:hypothetical protein